MFYFWTFSIDTNDVCTRLLHWDLSAEQLRNTASLDEGGVSGHRSALVKKVRQFIHKRAHGQKGGPHLSPPMVETMMKGLTRAPYTAEEIRATLVVLAAQGEVTVQWDLRGQGSKGKVPQGGMQEVAATLQRWGETPAAVRSIISAAQRRVSQKPVGEVVVLDWGTGWEGMKEGTSRVVRTYGIDRERHLIGQKEGYTVPDLLR